MSEQILLTYSQSYNDVFHNASYSRGGVVRATFFNSEGAKINNSLGPPVFDLLDTPLIAYESFAFGELKMLDF